jgi:hypothetical protein
MTLVIIAVLLGLLLFWVIRKRYNRSGEEAHDEEAHDVDENGEPRRRKRPWL